METWGDKDKSRQILTHEDTVKKEEKKRKELEGFEMKERPCVLQAEAKSNLMANVQTAQQDFLPCFHRVTCMAFGHSCEV
ncbi:hypothetical protein PoB_006259200 [Plakobranchus ocellatus]|uniref:Uncharacterized protein n=1 Tax=Plakobranchus ocellatus TaxID=259542 RepID=A0AAV4CVZ7_9GAST|nr:hypothetical protein PoB_006259200 [Plakobranchus ocellatus]